MKRKCARFTIWLQNKTKKVSCTRWKCLVQPDDEAITQIVKTRLRKAVARWNNQSALRCLDAWRKIAIYRRWLKAKEQRFLLRVRKRLLATGKKLWQNRARLAKRFKRHNLCVVRRLVMALLVRGFEAWYDAANEKARLRKRASKAVHRIAWSALAKFFHGWYECFRKRKYLTSRAIGVVRACTYRSLARALLHWRSQVMWSRQLYSETVQGILQMITNATSSAMITWRKHATEMRRLRARTKRVAQRFPRYLQARTFERWFQTARDKKLSSVKAKALRDRRVRASVSGYLSTWHCLVGRSAFHQTRRNVMVKGVQFLLKRQLGCKLRSVLQAWQEGVEQVKSKANEAVGVALRRQKCSVVLYFVSWHDHAMSASFEKARQSRQMACVRGVQGIIARLMMANATSSAMITWRKHATEMRRLRARTKRVAQRFPRYLQARTFERWFQTARDKKLSSVKAKALRDRRVRASVSGYLSTWHCLVGRSAFHQTRRNVMVKGVQFLLKRQLGCKLRSVLQAWQEGVEQVKSKANEAVGVALRRQKCSVVLYFVSWHDHAMSASFEKARQSRQMACVRGVQGIIARLLEATLASAYKRWCDAVEGLGYRASVVIKRGAAKRITLLISDSFLAWSKCASIRAQRKENLDRLTALISGLSQHLFSQYLSYAYRKWFDCALYSRSCRRKAKIMLEARNKRSRSRCIHKWCYHAMLMCRNRMGLGQLLSRMAEHTVFHALVQWREYVAYAAREKRVKANAERLVFRRQKASIQFSWSTWRVSTIEKVVTRCC
jgi:hypothetical protein